MTSPLSPGNTSKDNQPIEASTPLTVVHPRASERAEEREAMVRQQIVGRNIQDPRIVEAMQGVPRHWFVPELQQARAYDDGPLSIGFEQTISQPYIVALMTRLLAIRPGEKVLEIGTGSGYQAAVLSEFTDQVFSMEIVEPLGLRTAEIFKQHGYSMMIRSRIGDGYNGWPEAAPFDAIIVTCAADEPPPPLIEQLAIGGRMCIPVNSPRGSQELILLRKEPDGSLQKSQGEWVRFVPMTGQAKEK